VVNENDGSVAGALVTACTFTRFRKNDDQICPTCHRPSG
jgi:hypothetical protein